MAIFNRLQPDNGTTHKPSTRPAHPRVLVADDAKTIADILSMFFKMQGMETAVAYNGEEAVDLARRFEPDLICSDLDMPVMDGYEAARKIRHLNPEVVLVAISARGEPEDLHRCREAGFDFHLRKPVSPGELRTMIAEVLPKTNL